jgi:hypothetical protein
MVDWKHGGHRLNCGSYTTLSLGEFSLSTGLNILTYDTLPSTAESSSGALGFHERQFLRALVQTDYDEDRYAICEQQVAVLANDPNGGPLITLFDYTYTPVQITIHSVTDSSIADH